MGCMEEKSVSEKGNGNRLREQVKNRLRETLDKYGDSESKNNIQQVIDEELIAKEEELTKAKKKITEKEIDELVDRYKKLIEDTLREDDVGIYKNPEDEKEETVKSQDNKDNNVEMSAKIEKIMSIKGGDELFAEFQKMMMLMRG